MEDIWLTKPSGKFLKRSISYKCQEKFTKPFKSSVCLRKAIVYQNFLETMVLINTFIV
jgi:hypothetical protein